MRAFFLFTLLCMLQPGWSEEKCQSWASLADFENQLGSLQARADTVADTSVRKELVTFLDSVDGYVKELVESIKKAPDDSKAMQLSARPINDMKDQMSDNAFSSVIMHDFDSVYNEMIGRDLRAAYRDILDKQRRIMDRKYFGKDMEEANILEGWVNSHVSWTKTTEPEGNGTFRHMGVSPIEITLLRLEPVALINKSNINEGGLVTVGITRHFLPQVVPCSDKLKEYFTSNCIKRIGLRLGAGAYRDDNRDTRFLFGGGVQALSFGFWIVDIPENNNTIKFGITLTDLGIIKKVLPFLL